MRTDIKTIEQRKKIIARIEKNLGKKIDSFELVELRGEISAIHKLGINPKAEVGSAWGLIIFCENEVFFYYPATEGMFDFFFRQNSGDGPLEDQFIRFNDFDDFKFTLPKKSLFSFLSPETNCTIIVSAKIKGEAIYFNFALMNKALPVLEKLEKALCNKS